MANVTGTILYNQPKYTHNLKKTLKSACAKSLISVGLGNQSQQILNSSLTLKRTLKAREIIFL